MGHMDQTSEIPLVSVKKFNYTIYPSDIFVSSWKIFYCGPTVTPPPLLKK